MIDNIVDSAASGFEENVLKDNNKEIGQRVRKYTLVNIFFDNYLRVNKSMFITFYLKYLIIFTFLIDYIYNKLFLKLPTKENLNMILNDYISFIFHIGTYIFSSFFEKVNFLLIEILNIRNFEMYYVNIYPLKMQVVNIITMYIITITIFIYYILIFYQYLTQRDLFNATFTQYYVPLWCLYIYSQRNKKHYIFIKLIKHQKQNNIISIYSENILKNIFNLENIELDKKDKIDIHLTPKKLFLIYDYYKLTYTINRTKINDLKTSNVEQEVLKEVIEEVRNEPSNNLELDYLDNIDIENIK